MARTLLLFVAIMLVSLAGIFVTTYGPAGPASPSPSPAVTP